MISDSEFLGFCEAGDVRRVEKALKQSANVNAKNSNGTTALMYASANGHADVAELLLKNGANVNAKDNDSRTALILAAFNGHVDVVEFLMKNGARR